MSATATTMGGRLSALVRQGGWYLAAGAAATVVNAGIFLLLREPLGHYAANLVAISVTTVANTEFHRLITFDNPQAPMAKRAVAIVLTVLFYASYTSSALFILHRLVADPTAAQQVAAIVMAAFIGGIARFVMLRSWAFRPHVR